MTEEYSDKQLQDLPFMNDDLELEERINDLLARLTLDEKIKLSYGKRVFFVNKIKRLGIPYFKMTDGPHGIGTGVFFLKKTTYFPVAIARAATWNRELSREFGIALGKETRAVGRQVILAPGINIDRTPLCGRTFEYQTEDPYLNKELAVEMVKGVQSRRIATCVKHYVANNQEKNRFRVNAVVGERALQEIYLPAFKATVEEADAWSFMACYNKFNGTHGCENERILRDILMDQWGFRGFVVSDWFATRFTSTEGCIKAGLSLEMPKKICYKPSKIKEALNEGKVSQELFDDNVRRLLRVMFLTGVFDDKSKIPPGSRNTPEITDIAKKIAEEGIILLKNQDNLLPLDSTKIKSIAVLGPNANKKTAFGGGSSMIRAKYEITPKKGIKKKVKGKVKITKNAENADYVIYVGGLNHKKHMDRENKDRLKLALPDDQIEEINDLLMLNKNIIVVLVNGSPVSMENWIDHVPAVLEAWYGGCEAGNAIADVILGNVNPSGKLPITFPKKLSDSPAHQSKESYPGDDEVIYKEGIYVGYRYFDTNNIEPLFPFGHGLSYTSFSYDNLQLDKSSLSGNDTLTISVEIKNTGDIVGKEVVQLYIKDIECSIERPEKELKGFEKISLDPGEKKSVQFKISKEDFSFFDENSNRWKAEAGEFKILIGSSSVDIRLEGSFQYEPLVK